MIDNKTFRWGCAALPGRSWRSGYYWTQGASKSSVIVKMKHATPYRGCLGMGCDLPPPVADVKFIQKVHPPPIWP